MGGNLVRHRDPGEARAQGALEVRDGGGGGGAESYRAFSGFVRVV